LSGRSASPVILLAYREDPLAVLADRILADHRDKLPDLGQIAVILPHPAASARLRRLLLERASAQNHQALLPPWIGTLPQWLTAHDPDSVPLLNQAAREVLLYDAIADHPELCAADDRWALAENLLRLFDDLAHNHHPLSGDADNVRHELARAYGITGPLPAQLQGEADLLFRLWRAWQEHVKASGRRDPGDAYVQALSRDAGATSNRYLYVAGLMGLSTRELDWLRAQQTSGQTRILLQGNGGAHGYNPETPVQQLLDALDVPAMQAPADDLDRFMSSVYASAGDIMARRAQSAAAECSADPLRGRLSVFAAMDAEQEALAVELQVRRWWLAGSRHIGIVTNDRKLARRVRALLERANIQLQDGAGWRLSTTSAATALARLLDCVELNFHSAPLLDLLKSPFFAPSMPGANDLDGIRRLLERELVLEGRVQEDLGRYRRQLDAFRNRSSRKYEAEVFDRLGQLLDLLEAATSRLTSCVGRHPLPLGEFLSALQYALEQLGIQKRYAADAAGARLLALLSDMQHAAAEHGGRRLWREFRGWLMRQLEGHNFQPGMAGEGVELMGFAESRLYAFDAVIIAGANNEQLPGNLHVSPFFNDAVRAELGLGGTRELRNLLLYDFRRLLQSAPQVLITWRREQDGEALLPSPWLERLQTFHALAYGADALHDGDLGTLLKLPQTRIHRDDGAPLPQPVPSPRPAPGKASLPHRVSASSYQRLVDCPYRYYAYDCLGLADIPDPKEELEKSDFGLHVHRILQRFAELLVPGADGALPPPAELEQDLQHLSHAEFATEINRDILARGWYHRWLDFIPEYLRWETGRQQHWRIAATESQLERRISDDPGIELHGRIDRVDQHAGDYAIIDYKTGTTARREEMEDGENVQLPFYALLLGRPVSEARFVQFENEKVKDRSALEAESLQELVQANERRLLQLHRALSEGATLPAWGDEQTCNYCRLGGMCRKQYWPSPEASGSNP